MEKNEGLKKLREPFPATLISKLPKPTKQQTDEVRADFKTGVRCEICGAWHHPKVVHLDYVGHAALTDRLLDADPTWNWEPLSSDPDGLPRLDRDNGLWIKLTVCGVTRLGYGDAEGKTGGNAMKERIGDALRNAAMRFGAALDLWHKGDLHPDQDDDGADSSSPPPVPPPTAPTEPQGTLKGTGPEEQKASYLASQILAMKKKIWAKSTEHGIPKEQIKEFSVKTFGKESSKDWSFADADAVLTWLTEQTAAQEGR